MNHDYSMNLDGLRAQRLASQRLSDPATDIAAAARHMAATQAQEFWAGRWAIGVRTAGHPTLDEVDAAFDGGELVRSWTQRGTLHIVPAEDLAAVLAVTADRQTHLASSVHRGVGLTASDIDRGERAVLPVLAGGNRLTRTEFADVLAGAGVDPAGMRGSLILSALAIRGVVVWGPVVRREGAIAREQYIVRTDEWISSGASVADPLAELFLRYLRGHGPAGLADFRWWAGLPLGMARAAREGAADRVAEVEEGIFVVADAADAADAAGAATGDGRALVARRPDAATFALPPWDEYYLSYADRSSACAPERMPAVGPTRNGLVRPILVSAGEVIGTWSHSVAVGRHHLDPVPHLFDGGDEASAAVALSRFARFIRS